MRLKKEKQAADLWQSERCASVKSVGHARPAPEALCACSRWGPQQKAVLHIQAELCASSVERGVNRNSIHCVGCTSMIPPKSVRRKVRASRNAGAHGQQLWLGWNRPSRPGIVALAGGIIGCGNWGNKNFPHRKVSFYHKDRILFQYHFDNKFK